MVKICCIGAGYVGGPSMAVMALKCPAIDVAVVDVSRPRIDAWNNDRLPVLEPGLDAVVRECRGRNLSFSTDVDRHVADADIVFVSVNTPTKACGLGAGRAADLAYWESAARVIAAATASSRPGMSKIVVEKSAVPVRTAEAMERILLAHGGGKAAFQVLSNPEFFAEGTAVRDLLCPDRVLIGGRDTDAGRAAARSLRDVYANWVPEDRIVSTGLCSAELAKLAANALLAQRISSVNSMSALCESIGADVTDVARAVGGDGRVGGAYLNAGVGFGGPSLQKDVLLLAYACEWHGLAEAAEYWRQVVAVNEYQKGRFVRRVVASMFGTVAPMFGEGGAADTEGHGGGAGGEGGAAAAGARGEGRVRGRRWRARALCADGVGRVQGARLPPDLRRHAEAGVRLRRPWRGRRREAQGDRLRRLLSASRWTHGSRACRRRLRAHFSL